MYDTEGEYGAACDDSRGDKPTGPYYHGGHREKLSRNKKNGQERPSQRSEILGRQGRRKNSEGYLQGMKCSYMLLSLAKLE